MIITLLSDTHTKHKQVTQHLPGGDLLIHAGDISSMGYRHEIVQFCEWFNSLDKYSNKVFIAGNHDWGFQNNPLETAITLKNYPTINYLEDDMYVLGDDYQTAVKVWGSPWQPEFCNWAFNLPKRGEELQIRWDMIPANTDILVTHGPAYGYCDMVIGQYENLGCELLVNRIKKIKPKIHVCGHIHSGYGYKFDGDTHFFNVAVLDERYNYTQKPITIDWNPVTNAVEFLDMHV